MGTYYAYSIGFGRQQVFLNSPGSHSCLAAAHLRGQRGLPEAWCLVARDDASLESHDGHETSVHRDQFFLAPLNIADRGGMPPVTRSAEARRQSQSR